MTIAIHQPNFFPWLGYFYKIANSDIFVFLDDVEYSKQGFTNRNFIKTNSGKQLINIPVQIKNKSKQKINECLVSNPEKKYNKLLNTIFLNYKRSKNFEKYYPELEKMINKKYEKLSDLNIETIKYVCESLKIKTKIIRSSSLNNITGTSTLRLVNIYKKLNANVYLAGFDAINYQDNSLFYEKKIKPAVSSFIHPEYPQLWGEFIPNLSVLDYLFNFENNIFEND